MYIASKLYNAHKKINKILDLYPYCIGMPKV